MTIRKIFYLCIATTILSSCYKEKFIPAGEGLADWSVSTHSSAAVPNYALVFPQDKVNRFDISIDPSDWADLQEDLDNLYGGSSAGGPGGPVTFAEDAPIYVPCNLEFGGLNW